MRPARPMPRLETLTMTRPAACAALIVALSGAPVASTAWAADAEHPAVVELFQSQGCSDCPPANANLIKLTGRPDVLALSFGVTYWDQLGWRDTFASPQYTARQWDYAHALHHAEVFTPQVVVNGRADIVGSRPGEIEALIARQDRGDSGPQVQVQGGAATVAGGSAPAAAEVWMVRYDPRTIEVPIRAGENDGRTLPHKNVVRQLVKLGAWRGGRASFTLPSASEPGLRTAVLVQAGPGGAIVAAARG